MYNYHSGSSNVAFFSGFKVLVLIGGMIWTLKSVFPIFGGNSLNLCAVGEYFPMQYPDYHKAEMIDTKGKSIELKYVWQFTVKNESPAEIKDVTLELPFGGLYKITREDVQTSAKAANFDNNVKIDSIQGYKEIHVTVWTDTEFNPGMESQTRLNHPSGSLSIDYPVKVRGAMAWLVNSKLLLAVMGCIVLLLYML